MFDSNKTQPNQTPLLLSPTSADYGCRGRPSEILIEAGSDFQSKQDRDKTEDNPIRSPTFSASDTSESLSADILKSVGGRSGVFGTSINFINTILGSGILGLPQALAQTGLGFGLFLLAFVAWISVYSCKFIIKIGRRVNQKNYEELCEFAYGKFGFYAISISCALLDFGALSAYSVMIYQTIPMVANEYIFDHQATCDQTRNVVVVGTVIVHVFMLPLCLLKDLSRLEITSGLSVLTFAAIYLISFVRAPSAVKALKDAAEMNPNLGPFIPPASSFFNFKQPLDFFKGIGTFAFALICLDSVYLIHESLSDQTPRRWTKVTHISIGFLFVLYASFSVVLFLWFGEQSNGNILCSYPLDDIAINVARVGLGITIALTYPMSNFVFRSYLLAMLREWIGPRADSRFVWAAITVVTMMTTVALALVIGDLGIIMSMTGLVSATLCGFVIPVFVLFKIEGFNEMKAIARIKLTDSSLSLPGRISGYSTIILPIFILIFGVISIGIGAPA
eukprot:263529_1